MVLDHPVAGLLGCIIFSGFYLKEEKGKFDVLFSVDVHSACDAGSEV